MGINFVVQDVLKQKIIIDIVENIDKWNIYIQKYGVLTSPVSCYFLDEIFVKNNNSKYFSDFEIIKYFYYFGVLTNWYSKKYLNSETENLIKSTINKISNYEKKDYCYNENICNKKHNYFCQYEFAWNYNFDIINFRGWDEDYYMKAFYIVSMRDYILKKYWCQWDQLSMYSTNKKLNDFQLQFLKNQSNFKMLSFLCNNLFRNIENKIKNHKSLRTYLFYSFKKFCEADGQDFIFNFIDK